MEIRKRIVFSFTNNLCDILENRMDFVMERDCYLIWDCGCGNINKYIGGISQNKDNQEIEDEVFAMKKICRYVSILFIFMMILSLKQKLL